MAEPGVTVLLRTGSDAPTEAVTGETGEPLEGVDDLHFHPVVPRMLRVGMRIGF